MTRVAMCNKNTAKLASQAALWYNEVSKLLCLESVSPLPRAVYNLLRRLQTLDTLPPHAKNDNSSIPTTAGIYKITCTANGKIYIGNATNLLQRKYSHWSSFKRNKHDNPIMQHAWNKYGEQSFVFEVIELVLMREMLTAREQYWFKRLEPFGDKGFNINHKAETPPSQRGKKYTPEHRKRISQSHLGKKHTPEHIENGRQAHIGLKRSPEATEKQRQKLLGRKQSPEVIEKRIYPHRGTKRSPEAVENIRKGQRARRERERKEKLHDQNSQD
jgi:group I intron endonuclease